MDHATMTCSQLIVLESIVDACRRKHGSCTKRQETVGRIIVSNSQRLATPKLEIPARVSSDVKAMIHIRTVYIKAIVERQRGQVAIGA